MPYNVVIPAVGESITEGTVARFLVASGAIVAENTPLFELETDKVSTEVPAGASGQVKFLVKEGDVVQVGAVVAEIDTTQTAAAKPAAAAAAAAAPTPAPAPAARPAGLEGKADGGRAASPNAPLSPSVKKLVADNRLDPAAIPASGKEGRLTKGDVLAHLEAKPGVTTASPSVTSAPSSPSSPSSPTAPPTPSAPAASPAPAATPGKDGGTRKRMSSLRARIAQRLVQAQHTAAILTTFNEIDMTACMEMRKRFKEEFEKKQGVGLGFMSFFTTAVVKALGKYPMINSQIDGNDLVSYEHIHVGIAVGTEKGLVVPVVRNAQRKSFAEIEKTIREYALKAREGKLTIDDMQGGTFTITNGGTYGSLMSTPIINPPQSGILGMHAIKDRPIALNGQVVIRPMMYVALSYDHRLVDGAEAVGFLVRVKELIEAPERMVLGL